MPVPGASRARRAAPWLVVSGLALVGAALWGHLDPSDSRLVHDLLDHPVLLGLMAYVLVAAGVRAVVRDRHRRLVATLLLALVGAAVFGLTGMVMSMGIMPGRDEVVLPAPVEDGVTPFEAVVTTDGQLEEPVTTVVVQHRDRWSTSSRRWQAACTSAPYTDPDVRAARWEGPSVLVVPVGRPQPLRVRVDPTTGQPREVTATGVRCGQITTAP